MNTTIPVLPVPPDPDDPETFDDKGAAWSEALGPWGAAVQAVGDETQAAKNTAVEAAAVATAQAAASASAVGAAKWVAGTNYPTDSTAWSPGNKQTYRRNAPGGVSNVDPYLDTAGWTRVSGGDALPQFLLNAQGIV